MEDSDPNLNKNGKSITKAMILAASARTKSSNMSQDQLITRITHLHLQSKKIRYLDNLDLCTDLKVLYLYDNKIDVIENIQNLTGLSYLYLESNQIKKLPEFKNTKLRKLFLDENCIDYVKGLNHCKQLEVLTVARQRLPKYTSLSFDAASLSAIANSLQILDISGNGISSLAPFTGLFNLQKLFCTDNNIADLAEGESMMSLPYLEEVNFLRNPMCTLRHYKDYMIGAASNSLRLLDEVPVSERNIVAVRGLQDLRRKIGLQDRSSIDDAGGHPQSGHTRSERSESRTYSRQESGNEEYEERSVSSGGQLYDPSASLTAF